jgi:hypothetical protein
MIIAEKSLPNTSQMRKDMRMSEQSENTILQKLTSSAADSPVRTSQAPEKEQGLTESEADFGESMPESLANYDRDSSLWKTSQRSLFGGWSEFSETWPRSGMTRNGKLYPLRMLERPMKEKEFGWWPTPREGMWHGGDILSQINQTDSSRKRFPKGFSTPTATDWKRVPLSQYYANKPLDFGTFDTLGQQVARECGSNQCRLNPPFVEWLMGYPIEWTALKPSETPLSLKSPNGSGEES